MREITFAEALSEGLVQAMEQDDSIFVTGIAVDYPSGIFGSTVEVDRITLRPGDILFVYTDGASELLEHTSPETAGVDQLASSLENWAAEPAQEIVDHVVALLGKRAGDQGLPDDTTLMVAKVNAHP